MSDWFDGYVKVNGVRIHYWRTGGDEKPVVVFNHGAMDSGVCWTPVVQALEDDFDCIMVDARGHGKSDIGTGDYSSVARAADLLGVLEALELDRPVVGGHSMGADTCIHLAADYPDAARAIFLEDPPMVQPEEATNHPADSEQNDDMWGVFIKLIQKLKQVPKEEGYQMAREFNPTFPENEIVPWVESKIELSEDFQENLFHGTPLHPEEVFEVIKKVSIPALLIIGDKEHMAIVSEDTARKVCAANPNVRYVQFSGASHNIRRDRFEAYLTTLKQFLASAYGIDG